MKRNKLSNALPDRSRIALSREEMREFGYRVVDLLAEHFADVREERVGSKADPAKLIPLFADDPPELGRDPNELLAQLERDVLPNNLHVDHPRFFAFVPGPNNFVSTMADAIAAGFNIFNGTWFGGPAAAALELGVIRWLGRICAMPPTAGGLFVSGGSGAHNNGRIAPPPPVLKQCIYGATPHLSCPHPSSRAPAPRVQRVV